MLFQAGPMWLAILSIAAALTATPAVTAAPKWRTYEHPDPRFSIAFPDDWNVIVEPTGYQVGTHVVFGENRPPGAESWPVSYVVRSIPLPPNTTLDTIEVDWRAARPRAGYQSLRLDRITVDGRPGLMSHTTQPSGHGIGDNYVLEMLVIANGRMFVVDGRVLAKSKRLQQDLALLHAIFLTFRIP